MIKGIASVWVPVQDMDRAMGFYQDTLGLKVAKQDDDWAEVDANGVMVGLNGREGEGARKEGGAVISFQPEGGIEDAKSQLEDAGGEFPADISEHPWGKIATFKDSEGNDLQLYAPPA